MLVVVVETTESLSDAVADSCFRGTTRHRTHTDTAPRGMLPFGGGDDPSSADDVDEDEVPCLRVVLRLDRRNEGSKEA